MIAFDLDDVVVNTDKYLREQIIKRESHDISGRTDYRIEIPNMNPQHQSNLMEKLYQDAFVNAQPNEGTIKNIIKIGKLLNCDIKFITARRVKENTKKNTKDWLHKHIKNAFDFSVSFSNGKSKLPFIADDIKYFVEDHPFFAKEISKKVDTVFLMEKSWNKTQSFSKNVIRINNFSVLYRYLSVNSKFE